MQEARLNLMQAFEKADKELTDDEKEALGEDLLGKIEGWL